MMKTSYSTIFNEGLDFSTVLLDRSGELIAEKNYTPSMMGAIPNTVRWTLEEFGEEFFEPGDVVVHNDPYRGNCHIPEHMMMKPIFHERRAGRLRRRDRPSRRGRRQGARQLRRRRDRRLPGGAAPAAGQADRAGAAQRAGLARDPGQPSHAAQHLGRLPRHDRRAQRRRAAARRADGALRRGRRSSRAPGS